MTTKTIVNGMKNTLFVVFLFALGLLMKKVAHAEDNFHYDPDTVIDPTYLPDYGTTVATASTLPFELQELDPDVFPEDAVFDLNLEDWGIMCIERGPDGKCLRVQRDEQFHVELEQNNGYKYPQLAEGSFCSYDGAFAIASVNVENKCTNGGVAPGAYTELQYVNRRGSPSCPPDGNYFGNHLGTWYTVGVKIDCWWDLN